MLSLFRRSRHIGLLLVRIGADRGLVGQHLVLIFDRDADSLGALIGAGSLSPGWSARRSVITTRCRQLVRSGSSCRRDIAAAMRSSRRSRRRRRTPIGDEALSPLSRPKTAEPSGSLYGCCMISDISSSARPAATARLPIESDDLVAAPSALSVATAIMPTIIVEATTSMSDRARDADVRGCDCG